MQHERQKSVHFIRRTVRGSHRQGTDFRLSTPFVVILALQTQKKKHTSVKKLHVQIFCFLNLSYE